MTSAHATRHTRQASASAAAIVAILVLANATAARAVEEHSPTTEEGAFAALDNIERTNPDLILEPVDDLRSLGGVALGRGTVALPSRVSEGVTFTDPQGDRVTIRMPDAGDAKAVKVRPDGAALYLGELSANVVIVAEEGVQMLTTINVAAAATRYAYSVDLQPGDHIELDGSGPLVIDGDGAIKLAASPAWAIDAKGQPVPTWYEVDGDALVQVVDHTSVDDVAYPVVADPVWLAPWMVRCLTGLGMSGAEITRIASMGTPLSILAAFGRGAVACVFGK